MHNAKNRRAREEFKGEATKWLETAHHPRWNRPYTELVYQPMLEVLRFLRTNGYKTYIVTGGGHDFARMGSEKAESRHSKWWVPPQVPSTSTTRTGGRRSLKSRSLCCSTTLLARPKAFT